MSSNKALSNKDMNGNKVTNLGVPSAATSDAARILDVETAKTNAKSRANHTGTQLANTISNFDTQVRTNRLDQLAVPTAAVALNNQQITGLADGSAASHAATKGQLDTAISGLVSGQTLKGAVRVAVTSNVNLAAPGGTLDGIAMTNGDVFLATAQTTATQNGPYVFNGAAAAATRATNWDENTEAVLGSYWVVRRGNQG